jgi:hypothetical protein
MADDGIPEILAEQRLGHQVPGIRGLYAHASGRMRDDLKHALQTRWEASLRDRRAWPTSAGIVGGTFRVANAAKPPGTRSWAIVMPCRVSAR